MFKGFDVRSAGAGPFLFTLTCVGYPFATLPNFPQGARRAISGKPRVVTETESYAAD